MDNVTQRRSIKRILIVAIGISIFCLTTPAKGQDATAKPNIIFIMVDQMRPDHLIGPTTPNLSTLSEEGVRFIHNYTASPLCQPSRISIITGLYPSQTKIYGNQTGPLSDELRDNTFMNELQKAGYYTGFIGKHHYIDRYATGTNMIQADADEIKKYGFDYVVQVADIGEHIPNSNHSENVDDYIYYLRKKGLEKTYFDKITSGIRSGIHPLKSEDTEDGFIGLTARDFIDNYNKDAPFYLSVSFIGPHPPYVVPEEFISTKPEDTVAPIGSINNDATRLKRARYKDMISQLDFYVGKIVKSLKERGFSDNTVIIFTADHGDNLGDYGIWDKRYFYEQSAGVPLFISGKGIPGKDIRIGDIQSKALVSSLDIYPTIMNLAGVDISDRKLPGKNLLNIIKGNNEDLRGAVFSQLGTLVMIRTARWKMVFDPEEGGTYYLFNLINDPKELNNLAGVAGYEAITADLTKKLLSFYIGLDQSTQMKEQLRLQKVRVGTMN
ncbi:MAG: sulfatase-like hydrolase/transferase [Bacteroidetes bacterium]|nr:sulfatase-like hydrolase/transferase [Bacteroidota bacterium]MDA1120783.1 sulfatase-like hydrolase/transferase [Bacteroidota bacterium]